MKKILTLLIATGAFVSLHAQSREQTRDIVLGRGNNGQYSPYPNNGGYSNDRQYQMDQVNRDYDSKIYSIRSNRYLSNREKDRMIRQLEIDRRTRPDEINRYYNNSRYDRHDNGKHKGWYKNGKKGRDRDDR